MFVIQLILSALGQILISFQHNWPFLLASIVIAIQFRVVGKIGGTESSQGLLNFCV